MKININHISNTPYGCMRGKMDSTSPLTNSVHNAQGGERYSRVVAANEPMRSFENTRMLLIEDNLFIHNVFNHAFKNLCRVMTADTLNTGVCIFLDSPPDIVFLDIGLPDGSGYQALDFMLWNDPNAYIVIFSGSEKTEHAPYALELGAKGFIQKPFKKSEILEHLANCEMQKH